MSHKSAVSPAGKAAGARNPTVPPAFFILLIPAGLIGAGRWWWAPILAVVAGLFLTSLADSFGLWTQTVAVLVAMLSGALATRTNLRHRWSVTP